MGFWFATKAKKQARKGPRAGAGGPKGGLASPTARTKAHAPTLHRLGCKACPLDKADVCTPKMQPTLGSVGGIYFLAEAPEREDDESSGRPLTGTSGSILRSCLTHNFSERSATYDNCVRDRPPGGRTPAWHEIECCRGYITKTIEQQKPKLIVGLGVTPLNWMLGSTDVAGMRGRLFAVKVGSHKCWFLPVHDPAFLLKIAYNKKKPLNSKFGHCFRLDLEYALKLLPKLSSPILTDSSTLQLDIKRYDGTAPEHLTAVLQQLKTAKKAKLKAIDIETHNLRPYRTDSRILTAAVSHGDTHFSFAIDHPKAGWAEIDRIAILAEFENLITDDTIKIAHNAPFELEWLIWLYGKHIANHAAWHCTMMQAHFIDERRGKQTRGSDDRRAAYQSLDFLFKQHFGIAYKHLFKLDKRNMAAGDLSTMLTYNAVDTRATLMLYHRQVQLLKEQKVYDAYIDALPRQVSVALMQHLGVLVDQTEVRATQKSLGSEIAGIKTEIENLKVVKQYIKDNKEFNPQSDRDVLAVFKDYLKRKEVLILPSRAEVHDFDRPSSEKRKWDEKPEPEKARYSVDKNVLAKIDHPLAPLISKLRNKAKLKSTYCDEMVLNEGKIIFPDGYLHTSFNTTFAETGRTSSDEPNMQNFPKRTDAWVRRQIIPPPGHIILAVDYGQLEASTTAMCTRDKYLVKVLWEDYDTHMAWARIALDKCPEIAAVIDQKDDKKMKGFRSLIKNKLVFPAFFGAANESVCAYLTGALDLPIEQSHVDDLMDEFWSTFSGVRAWQDKTMKKYYETGWCVTPNGRKHRYPLTRNQVVNHPIQGLACEIVCEAMDRLSYKALNEDKWHLHPRLMIHDDLTFYIPDDERIIEESIIEIYKILLTPSCDVVNVPISCEVTWGKNWYDMEAIGKFYSNKDL